MNRTAVILPLNTKMVFAIFLSLTWNRIGRKEDILFFNQLQKRADFQVDRRYQ